MYGFELLIPWRYVKGNIIQFCKRGTSDSYGEGNGTPLQVSCLENTMDGGAW